MGTAKAGLADEAGSGAAGRSERNHANGLSSECGMQRGRECSE